MITVGKLSFDDGKMLGQGGFGIVYSGFYLMSESSKPAEVAVKRVEKGRVNVTAIESEMELMKKANHANILRYIHTETNNPDFM